MDWANERYVRLYTRDTVTWKMWPWEARAIFPLLMRKVDRAGVLDIGDFEPEDALAVLLDVPRDVVEAAWRALVSSHAVEARSGQVVVPNFIEAQETAQSDRQRAAVSRERRRDKARGVTPRHAVSRDVTLNQAKPTQTKPSGAEVEYPKVKLVNSGGYDAGDPVLTAINSATASCLSADQHGRLYTSAAERVREQDCTAKEVEMVLRAWAVDDKQKRPRQRALFYSKQWQFTRQRYLDAPEPPTESHGEATGEPEPEPERMDHEKLRALTSGLVRRVGEDQ